MLSGVKISEEVRAFLHEIASKGGKRRSKKLSAERLKEIARKGGERRSKKLSAERRREIASAGGKARWQKKEKPENAA